MKDPKYITELRSMMNSTRTTWRRHSSFAEACSNTDLFADLDEAPTKIRRTSDASVFGIDDSINPKQDRVIVRGSRFEDVMVPENEASVHKSQGEEDTEQDVTRTVKYDKPTSSSETEADNTVD
jgi:hypothetical protein